MIRIPETALRSIGLDCWQWQHQQQPHDEHEVSYQTIGGHASEHNGVILYQQHWPVIVVSIPASADVATDVYVGDSQDTRYELAGTEGLVVGYRARVYVGSKPLSGPPDTVTAWARFASKVERSFLLAGTMTQLRKIERRQAA